ncbi:MAG: gamma-glutamyltransferase [Gemmatimonadaceae bacterium]
MKPRPMWILLSCLVACAKPKEPAEPATPPAWNAAHHASVVTSDSAMVVTAAPLATKVGVDVLRSGGNAVDAAVAVAFALEVVYPTAGNIGGGGFIVARMGTQSAALDFRETAPGASTKDMYLDAKGNATDKSLTGALAAGVPGSVAGLFAAHEKFGSKPWRDLVQPAIDLAEKGFVTDSAFSEGLEYDKPRLIRFPASAALFAPHGAPVPFGSTWKNPDLAKTLKRIAAHGRDGFYAGETADLIVKEMKRSGGIISTADLAHYQAAWRTPVEFTYRGHKVVSMPPASSGGLTLALIANILSGVNLGAMGFHSADAIHTIAAAERAAFLRRNTLLGDPKYVTINTDAFLSPDTAAALRAAIVHSSGDERHTTHFSIVDAHGNAVSMTTTLNNGYGSAVTVTGAGFLLNDEMDDFTTKAGALNAMGLRQGDANAIQPGKRMLSSMTPTIVLDSAGAPMLVTGASGGARIITGVAQTIFNVLDFKLDLGAAEVAPRFHAQDFPDSLLLEQGGYSDALIRALGARGDKPKINVSPWESDDFAWVQSILRVNGKLQGQREPRGFGLAFGY